MTTASGLLSAFSRISVFTAISRVLGFTRDIILAAVLGIGPVSDAFFVAFKLPNLFRRLTAEGAMTSAFIPGYTGVEQSEGKKAAQCLAGEIQTMLVWVLLLILVVFEIFMPYVITAMAPGFAIDADASRFDGGIHLARLTMPYLPMVSLLALWIAIGNVYGRFALGASMPVIMNIVMISGAFLAWYMWPDLNQDGVGYDRAAIIAISVASGGVIKLLVIGTMLWRKKSLPPIYFFPRLSQNSRTLWRRFWPAALGSAGTQINLLIDTILASLLPIGAISQLYFADRIAQLPLGVVGIALGVALLPTLSRLEQVEVVDKAAVRQVLRRGIIIGMLAACPALAGIMAISDDLIRGLFAYGAFDPAMVSSTAAVLMAYGSGIPAFILVKTFQPSFYAAGDMTTPMRVTIMSVGINIVLSIVLMQVIGAAGLALATSISLWASTLILMLMLKHRGRLDVSVIYPVIKIAVASAVMAAGLVLIRYGLNSLSAWQALSILMLSSAGIYLPLIYAMRVWRGLKG